MSDGKTIRVALSEDRSRFVREPVASGGFGSASDVIAAGPRSLSAADCEADADAGAMRERVREGLDASTPGATADGREAIRRLKSRHDRLRADAGILGREPVPPHALGQGRPCRDRPTHG